MSPSTEPDAITRPSKPNGHFDRIAPVYEALANVHSAGQIRAAKASQLEFMAAQDRVLYVGVGAGEDAVGAAQLGADVTCIDTSAAMLRRTEAKLQAVGAEAECIHGDVREHQRRDHYDMVVANFFLNCFREEEMLVFLEHLTSLLRVGGRLAIADVAVPHGNVLSRWIHRIHNGIGITFFWILGLVPLHGIYDYQRYFADLGLETTQVQSFRLLKCGPVSYESIIAKKLARDGNS
jgi:demethylmenaquinone methyltransferase/2-methoxy-6-polyprenyl-1,4-benzoquinol methylase